MHINMLSRSYIPFLTCLSCGGSSATASSEVRKSKCCQARLPVPIIIYIIYIGAYVKRKLKKKQSILRDNI